MDCSNICGDTSSYRAALSPNMGPSVLAWVVPGAIIALPLPSLKFVVQH